MCHAELRRNEMFADDDTYGAFALLVSSDIKFVTILKKSNEIASILNVTFLHFERLRSIRYIYILEREFQLIINVISVELSYKRSFTICHSGLLL
jgi:hypothetical protein